MVEIAIVPKKTLPVKMEWAKKLRVIANQIKSNDKSIRVDLKIGEKPSGLETAWRKLCANELNKKPHVIIKKHQLGSTVWLSWE
jgi:hypothetical protein